MADEQTVDTQNLDADQASQASGDDLAARVQVLEEQLAGAQDQALRVAADLQNVRRRAEQDVRHRTHAGVFEFLLIPDWFARFVRE